MWPSQEYKIVIGMQTKRGFIEIKRLGVSLSDNSKKYGTGNYEYTAESFTHHKGRFHFAYFDKESAKLITYGEVLSDVNAEDSDTRNARGLVRTAIQNATSSYGLPMVILAAVAGLAGGFAVCFAIYPQIAPQAAPAAAKTAKYLLECLTHA